MNYNFFNTVFIEFGKLSHILLPVYFSFQIGDQLINVLYSYMLSVNLPMFFFPLFGLSSHFQLERGVGKFANTIRVYG